MRRTNRPQEVRLEETMVKTDVKRGMKYNVGDKVRVKSIEWYQSRKESNGDIEGGTLIFCSEMQDYCGKESTIVYKGDYFYKLDIDNALFSWEDWMLKDSAADRYKPIEIPTRLDTFESILKKMLSTYKAKNKDYGNSFDKTLNEFGLLASVIRMSDKMERIKTLINTEAAVKDEKIEDTILDLANYAVLTLTWMYEKR